jgi:Pre-PUA-like domain
MTSDWQCNFMFVMKKVRVLNFLHVGLRVCVVDYRFDDKEHLTAVNNVKSSIQKSIRSKIIEQFPYIEEYLEQIIPKKDPMRIAKW